MQIDSRARLSGVPLIDIGRMFRQAGLDGAFSVAFVRDQLEMDERRVMRLVARRNSCEADLEEYG
jgi:hypothetical protein